MSVTKTRFSNGINGRPQGATLLYDHACYARRIVGSPLVGVRGVNPCGRPWCKSFIRSIENTIRGVVARNQVLHTGGSPKYYVPMYAGQVRQGCILFVRK